MRGIPLVSHAINAKGGSGRSDGESETFIPTWINARQDPIHGETCGPLDCDPSTNAIAFNLRGREGGAQAEVDELASLRATSGGSNRSYVAFDETQITSRENRCNPQPGDPSHPLAAGARPPTIAGSAVRRLTPRECERLMGLPDDYTLIPYRGKPAADLPRYKAVGNSMAEPCMYWIGRRIQAVEDIRSRQLNPGS